MNALIYKPMLFIHVLCGITALLTGFMAMVARKKGGKFHKANGVVFYYAMLGIFVTTVIFFVLEPFKLKYQFFLGIGIVSFYPTYVGRRMLSMKKEIVANPLDWFAVYFAALSGVVMVGYGMMVDDLSFRILFSIFGTNILLNSFNDWRLYTGRKKAEDMQWFLGHAGRMIGAYSAAVTAFCVNVVPRYMPKNTPEIVYIATWVLPGLILGLVTVYTIRKYRKQFAVSK